MDMTLNKFTDILKNNRDKLIDTETLPGLILVAQQILVKYNLENTQPARELVNALLRSSSHDEAVQTLFKFMI